MIYAVYCTLFIHRALFNDISSGFCLLWRDRTVREIGISLYQATWSKKGKRAIKSDSQNWWKLLDRYSDIRHDLVNRNHPTNRIERFTFFLISLEKVEEILPTHVYYTPIIYDIKIIHMRQLLYFFRSSFIRLE